MELLERLQSMLEAQLELYTQIDALQMELQRSLDDSSRLQGFMELLARKNTLVDAIRAENQKAAPLLEEYANRRSELEALPGFAAVQSLNERLVGLVMRQRNQDEEMLRRFEGVARPAATQQDQQQHSRNLLNAFRALR